MGKMAEYSWDDSRTPAESERSIDIREYLGIVLKFKWGIVSVAFLAGLIGLYMAYKAVPIYRSTAILQVERQQNNMLTTGIFFPDYERNFYDTQYELIRSWGVAEMAAQRLGMLDADHLEGAVQAPAEPGFTWRSLLPDKLRTTRPEITPEVRRANIVRAIKGGTLVGPVGKSQLVTISFESADREVAAERANAVAESYIDFLRDKNLADITGDQHWFSSRMLQAREDLEAAQQALQDFLDRQGLLETEGGVDALQNRALNLALDRREESRQQKIALERLNRDIQEAQASGRPLDTITALDGRGIVTESKNRLSQARLEISRLQQRYGPKHPKMIEAQNAARAAMVAYETELQVAADAVLADYQRAVRTEREYSAQLDAAQADIQELNRNRAELTKLQDQVATSRSLFEQLQSGEQRTEILQGGVHKINATIIEPARPGLYPVRPDKRMLVLMWTLAGLVAGIGLAFLLESLDNTFKGSEDVEQRLNLPVLGQLPQLKVPKEEPLAPMQYFVENPRSAFSEAVRTIRTGVMLSLLDKEHAVVAVTSSIPGEGKTTVAINLAHAVAQMKKTLLIDADMRRPMVHRAQKIGRPRPGLAALMTGEVTLEEAMEVQQDGLCIVPSGAVPPNPLELLSSQKFRDLLVSLQAKFEVIIVDSAPALAVSDALVVAQLADAQIYVIRSDATPYQAAEQGVKRLRRGNAPLLGCVLNQVVSGSGKYGYGKYGKYGRYYRYYRYGRYGHGGKYGRYNPEYYREYYGDDAEK